MAIKIQSTRQLADAERFRVKCCVYGGAGLGKTRLCATAPRPLIMSAERGLLSLANLDVPFVEVDSYQEVGEVYDWLIGSEEARGKFDTICLDSASEIAEVCLNTLKGTVKDARQAYTETTEGIASMVRNFRDLPFYNVVFICKEERRTDDYTGITKYIPSMPGRQLTNSMPYFFDELFAMRIGTAHNGKTFSYIQPRADISYEAKDRSGALGWDESTPNMERPDLTFIFNKMRANLNPPGQPAAEQETVPEIPEQMHIPEESESEQD